MKRLFYCLIPFLLLCSSSAFAETGSCAINTLVEKLRAGSDQVTFDPQGAPNNQLFFYQFDRSLDMDDQIQVAFEVGEERFLTEKITLIESPLETFEEVEDIAAKTQVGTIIELLTSSAAALNRIYQMDDSGADLGVVIHVNGHLEERLSLSDLKALSDQLRQAAPLPHAVQASLQTPNVTAPLRLGVERENLFEKSACTNNCDAARAACYFNRCGQNGTPACFATCESEHVQCYETCGICVPRTTTTTSVQLVQITRLNVSECAVHPVFGGPDWYERVRLKYRTTTTTTVTNADCSQDVSTSTSYSFSTCWRFFANSCFIPRHIAPFC